MGWPLAHSTPTTSEGAGKSRFVAGRRLVCKDRRRPPFHRGRGRAGLSALCHMRDSSPIQLRARLRGAFAYICPGCSRIEKCSYINRRKPLTQCVGCGVKYGVGVAGFRCAGDAWRQLSLSDGRRLLAFRASADHDQLFNTLDDAGGDTFTGEIQGPVEWICPACGVRCHSRLDRSGTAACACGERLVFRLRLWSLTQGRRWTLPRDHVL